VARVLIVGGGCQGRRLAARLARDGHAVRVTTRREAGRAAIEASGAECWIGTPDRLATLRGALDQVAVACWLLAGARGEPDQLRALHGSRLEFFLTQAIDTTVRGFLYDATPRTSGSRDAGGDRGPGEGGEGGEGEPVEPRLLRAGARTVARLTELNAIPAIVLDRHASAADADAGDGAAWEAAAIDAIDALLAGRTQPLVVERD
jgi:hypothetical protein